MPEQITTVKEKGILSIGLNRQSKAEKCPDRCYVFTAGGDT